MATQGPLLGNGLIEHSVSQDLISREFESRGELEVYQIKVDPEGVYSAWTPIKEDVTAYKVTHEERDYFLHYDEMDNYYRMMLVPDQAVRERELINTLTNVEDLPEVGHVHRQQRERRELAEQAQRHAEALYRQGREIIQREASTAWDTMQRLNATYGHLYDLSAGKDAYLEDSLAAFDRQPFPSRVSEYLYGPIARLDERLTTFETQHGHPFTPQLDDADGAEARRASLLEQLEREDFLLKQGYVPKGEYDNALGSDGAVHWTLSLEDRYGQKEVEAEFTFIESQEYAGCATEPEIYRFKDCRNDWEGVEENAADHPMAQALMECVDRRFEGRNLAAGGEDEIYSLPWGPGFVHPEVLIEIDVLNDTRELRDMLSNAREVKEAFKSLDADTEQVKSLEKVWSQEEYMGDDPAP